MRATCAALQTVALPYLVLLQVGFAVPLTVTTHAVRSYRTFSPLPRRLRGIRRYLSVALSVGSRLPGVTWHLAHGARTFLHALAAHSDCLADSWGSTIRRTALYCEVGVRFELQRPFVRFIVAGAGDLRGKSPQPVSKAIARAVLRSTRSKLRRASGRRWLKLLAPADQ